MALTRQQKEAQVAAVEQSLSSAMAVAFMTYDAMGVEQVEELRDRLFAEGVTMRVLPKRLLRLVLKNLSIDFDPTQHEGQFAVVWGSDAVAPAKVIHSFAKEHENIKLVAGALEGKVLSQAEVTALAQLLSREELLAKLVGTLVNPIRGIQGVLTGVQREAVYVLHAIAEKKSA